MFKPDYKYLYEQMKARCDRQQSEIEELKAKRFLTTTIILTCDGQEMARCIKGVRI